MLQKKIKHRLNLQRKLDTVDFVGKNAKLELERHHGNNLA